MHRRHPERQSFNEAKRNQILNEVRKRMTENIKKLQEHQHFMLIFVSVFVFTVTYVLLYIFYQSNQILHCQIFDRVTVTFLQQINTIRPYLGIQAVKAVIFFFIFIYVCRRFIASSCFLGSYFVMAFCPKQWLNFHWYILAVYVFSPIYSAYFTCALNQVMSGSTLSVGKISDSMFTIMNAYPAAATAGKLRRHLSEKELAVDEMGFSMPFCIGSPIQGMELWNSWDKLQMFYGCCGVYNYTDWTTILDGKVPRSCCIDHTYDCGSVSMHNHQSGQSFYNFYQSGFPDTKHQSELIIDNIHQSGCLEKFTHHVNTQIKLTYLNEKNFFLISAFIILEFSFAMLE